jgi:uroporphyrinogen decarboxylase
MSDRRRFIARVLEGERSARLPRALFGAGLWSFRQTGLKIEDLQESPERFSETLSGFFGQLDTDIIFAGSGLNTFPAEAIGGKLAFRGEQAPLLSFPLIQKTEDARYLRDISLSHSPHSLALVEMISGLRQRLPDRYLCATSWGPFTWAMILCDWNLLQVKIASDRNFVHEICDLGVRLSLAFYAPLVERGLIDGISIPDGAVTLIPTDLYRDVILPYERKLFDSLKRSGIKCFLHQCGNIRSQTDFYPETGADCISVDAGVDLREIYERYRESTVTAGNVDVINTIYGGDPALICRAVSDCVSRITDPHFRYILMPSCDPPPDTPVRNVKEFLACADRAVPSDSR